MSIKMDRKFNLRQKLVFLALVQKNSEEFCPISMNSDNSKVYIGSEKSMVVDDVFKRLLDDYQYYLRT